MNLIYEKFDEDVKSCKTTWPYFVANRFITFYEKLKYNVVNILWSIKISNHQQLTYIYTNFGFIWR